MPQRKGSAFDPIIDTTARLARGGVGRDRSEPPGACSAHRRARPVGTSADTLLGVSATSLFASHAPRAMAVSDHSGAAASANRSSPNDSFPPKPDSSGACACDVHREESRFLVDGRGRNNGGSWFEPRQSNGPVKRISPPLLPGRSLLVSAGQL